MRRGAVALVIMLFGAATALELAAARSNAQTISEYAATVNSADALDGASQGMSNYHSDNDFRPSPDYGQGSDYRTNLDTSGPCPNSTDYATSGFGNTADYASSIYSGDNFTNSTDYKSDNDYSNQTDLPDPLN